MVQYFYDLIQYCNDRIVNLFLSCYQTTGKGTDYKRVYDAQQTKDLNNDSTDNFRTVHNELVSKIAAFKQFLTQIISEYQLTLSTT